MANEHRGEVDFDLGDLSFTARPTFKLIDAIEREFGVSILLMAGKTRGAALSFSETVRITVLAARHADKPPADAEKDDFPERVFQAGPMNLMKPVSQFLGAALTTGAPTKKEGGASKAAK